MFTKTQELLITAKGKRLVLRSKYKLFGITLFVSDYISLPGSEDPFVNISELDKI